MKHFPAIAGAIAWVFPALMAGAASASSTVRLPGWVCGQGLPPVFQNGFEAGAAPVYQEPSLGTGGAFPGAQTRNVVVQGESFAYHLHIPAGYPFSDPLPVLMVLHGQGGAGTAPAAAAGLRDLWSPTAQVGKFIVVAPQASGASGGWVPAVDYPVMLAVLQDVTAHYNVDTSRVHGWGFSAGGHVLHDLALRVQGNAPGIDTFAAYGVSAGVLPALVCNGAGLPSCATFLPQVARRIPVSLRVGTGDSHLPYVQADRSAFLAAGWGSGTTLDYATFSGGHQIHTAHFAATWAFLCRFQRVPG